MDGNTQDRVIHIISEQLSIKPESVKMDSEVVADLGADSLDTVELLMALEDEFNIEIPDDDAEAVKTVRDIVQLVNKKLI